MKKGKQLIFALVVCLVSFAFPVFAGTQKVFDYADLLTGEEEAELQQMAEAMVQDWGMDLAFLTTYDTEGMSVREYGADFYIEQDLGVGANYDGVIFVVDMTSREAQIVTSGKAIDVFTDYYLEKMWSNMQGDFADGYYFWGMETLVNDMNDYNAEYQKYLTDPNYVSEYEAEISDAETSAFLLVIAFFFSLIVAAISVAFMRSACKNVRPYSAGEAYLKQNGLYLSTDRNSFVNTRTTMTPIPKDDDDKGSWGGGSSTFNSGGRTFGGGGGGF